jgi:hypothetical protein
LSTNIRRNTAEGIKEYFTAEKGIPAHSSGHPELQSPTIGSGSE